MCHHIKSVCCLSLTADVSSSLYLLPYYYTDFYTVVALIGDFCVVIEMEMRSLLGAQRLVLQTVAAARRRLD